MYRNGNQGQRSANTRRIVSEAFRKRAKSKIICIQQERIEIMTSWNMKDWEYTCQVNNNQYHGTNIFLGNKLQVKKTKLFGKILKPSLDPWKQEKPRVAEWGGGFILGVKGPRLPKGGHQFKSQAIILLRRNQYGLWFLFLWSYFQCN